MPTLIAQRDFQHGGKLYRNGSVVTMSDSDIKLAEASGTKEKGNGKVVWVDGRLNHTNYPNPGEKKPAEPVAAAGKK
jgi:hypothetical protein